MLVEFVHVTDLKHKILNSETRQNLTETKCVKISFLNPLQRALQEIFVKIIIFNEIKELFVLILLIITVSIHNSALFVSSSI